MERVYAPAGVWKETITVQDSMAVINTGPDEPPFLLRFAPSRRSARPIPAYWRSLLRSPESRSRA